MTWNGDVRAAFLAQKLLLSFVGVWPVKSRDCFMDLRWTLAVLSQFGPMMAHFMEVYLHCNGVKESFDSLTSGSGAALALTRLIVYRVYREELLTVISTVIDDWSTKRHEKEQAIMKKYLRISVRVTKFMCAWITIIIGVYSYQAVLIITSNKNTNNLGQNNTLFEYETSSSCIFHSASTQKLFAILETIQVCITTILTLGVTSFFFGLVMHLCGQLDVLGDSITNSSEDTGLMITRVVKRHYHLIEQVKNLDDSFRTSLLAYVFITGLVVCVEDFLVICALHDKLPGEVVNHLLISLAMLVQLSFYTVAGDYLEDRSLQLSYSVYAHDWYNLPPRTVKDLQLILQRTGIPHELTAGKIMPMNMITMKQILMTTASYLSVLRVLIDE